MMMMTRQRSTSKSNLAKVLAAGRKSQSVKSAGRGVERRIGNGEQGGQRTRDWRRIVQQKLQSQRKESMDPRG